MKTEADDDDSSAPLAQAYYLVVWNKNTAQNPNLKSLKVKS